MEKELSTYVIHGIPFWVNVERHALVEKNNPKNIWSFFEMDDNGHGYTIDYDRRTKEMNPITGSSADLMEVNIPYLFQLDPIRMAERYNVPIEDISQGKYKDDFEIRMQERALKDRITGRQPILDIAGQTFFVHLFANRLEPRDDFMSEGISFREIRYYADMQNERYQIPYDPKKHEFVELDEDYLTEIPKGLIMVEFPHERFLDPVGFGWSSEKHLEEVLSKTLFKSHFEAKIIPWEKTQIGKTVAKNAAEQEKEYQHKPKRRIRR